MTIWILLLLGIMFRLTFSHSVAYGFYWFEFVFCAFGAYSVTDGICNAGFPILGCHPLRSNWEQMITAP